MTEKREFTCLRCDHSWWEKTDGENAVGELEGYPERCPCCFEDPHTERARFTQPASFSEYFRDDAAS